MIARRVLAAALLGLLAGAAGGRGTAVAQTAAAEPAVAPDVASLPRAGAPTPRAGQIAANVEQHIVELHRRLRITPAQQAPWEAFAQILRDNAAHSAELRRTRAETGSTTALDDLRAYTAMARAHAEDVQRLLAAFQALYEAMSPGQQKIADSAFKEFEQRGPRPGGQP